MARLSKAAQPFAQTTEASSLARKSKPCSLKKASRKNYARPTIMFLSWSARSVRSRPWRAHFYSPPMSSQVSGLMQFTLLSSLSTASLPLNALFVHAMNSSMALAPIYRTFAPLAAKLMSLNLHQKHLPQFNGNPNP